MRSARRFDAQVCTRISPSDRISALRASRLFEPSVSTPRSIFEHDESTSSARSAGLEVRASSAVDSRSTQPGRWSLTSRDVGFVRTEPGVSQATVDQHTRQSGTQGYRAHREIGPTGRSRSPAPRRRMVGDGRRKMDEGKRPRGNGRGETERTGSFPVDPRESPLRPALRPARSPARPRNTKGAGGF